MRMLITTLQATQTLPDHLIEGSGSGMQEEYRKWTVAKRSFPCLEKLSTSTHFNPQRSQHADHYLSLKVELNSPRDLLTRKMTTKQLSEIGALDAASVDPLQGAKYDFPRDIIGFGRKSLNPE